MVELPGAS